jgi:hypothetical protein
MSTVLLRAAGAFVLAAVTSACDATPTSPLSDPPRPAVASFAASSAIGADREVVERFSDFTDVLVSYPCGDGYTEQIRMEGQIFERFTITRDGSGGLHARTHTMPIGLRGIGLTSGAEYRVTEREQGAFNQGAMEQTASTYKSFLFVSAPSIHVHATLILGGKFTVNANGELVIEKPTLRIHCQTTAL